MPITFSANNFSFPVLLARHFFFLRDKMRKDSLRIEVKILFKTIKCQWDTLQANRMRSYNCSNSYHSYNVSELNNRILPVPY